MRHLIGVFTSERHAGALATLQRCDESAPERELRLGTPYLRAVEAAGGLPVVLAPAASTARRYGVPSRSSRSGADSSQRCRVASAPACRSEVNTPIRGRMTQ